MSAAPLLQENGSAAAAVREVRRRSGLRRRAVLAALAAGVVVLFFAGVLLGSYTVTIPDFVRILAGERIPGASFIVMESKLPRAVTAILIGTAFGVSGHLFQTMLRNPLASPDIIGISAGASAAAAFAIIGLSLGGAAVSVFAITAGLAVALAIYALSWKSGVAGTRLILIGIGVAAMLDSFTAYMLSQAPDWEMQEAMRWLTGSLNGAAWAQVVPVLAALAVFGPALLSQTRNLAATRLGDDTAAALGVRVDRTRLVVIVAAVALISFATAAAGPIAFVAFLAGPIAARLVGPGPSLLVPAALVGALLVLAADFLGQYAFGTRYPVGIITGVLGAPYLVYLIVRVNRAGASL